MDRITEVTRDLLDALIQVRRLPPESLPEPPALHRQLRSFVDALFMRSTQHGFGRDDADAIAYALVALADEIVLSRSDEVRNFWAGQSLQLHYFHENVAGEAFFTRLSSLRGDPGRQEVLRVYYLALLLGFRGRYQVRGGELELMTLTEELQHELSRAHRFEAGVLSPHGERPEEAGRRGSRKGPAIWVGVGVLLAAALAYAGLRVSLDATTHAARQRIDAVTAR